MADDNRVAIRTAGPDDADVIADITRTAFGQFEGRVYPPFRAHAQTPAHVRWEMEAKGFVYGLALVDGRPAGHVRWRLRPGYMHVSRLAVLPECRGFGVGRRLMAWAEEEARRRRVRVLRGEVRTALTDVLKYYMAMGYRVIGYASLHGVPRCLTLIEKRLSYRRQAARPARPEREERTDDAAASAAEEAAWVDEARISPRLLHPALARLIGPPAQRSRRNRR